ncbi:T9SS type A sorting domain-containing protein [bacterium]|nr:T9SS type A sorting domain-containing protein [bacterium]
MRNYMWIMFMLFVFTIIPVSVSAQWTWNVAVIDTFVGAEDATHGNGVSAVNAIYHDGAIHLAFDIGDNVGVWGNLTVYATRTLSGYVMDTLANTPYWANQTAIQFNESGEPWVYAEYPQGHDNGVCAYHKSGGVWTTYPYIDTPAYNTKVIAAAENTIGEIGFAYLGQIPGIAGSQRLRYARWDGTSWTTETLFEDPDYIHRTQSCVVYADSGIYLSFIVGSFSPNVSDLHVLRRSGLSWSTDFTDALPFTSFIGNERGVMGVSNTGQIHLWRSATGYTRYFYKSPTSWTSVPVDTMYPWGVSYGNFIVGTNIQFSSDNTAFMMVSNVLEKHLCWRKADGSFGGLGLELPYPGTGWNWGIHDFVITPDDSMHIFYSYGIASPSWMPNVFLEATAYIDDITSGIDEAASVKPDRLTVKIYPNPFNSAVHIFTPPKANLEIFDINGKRVAKIPGGNQIWEPNTSTGSGVYFVRTNVGDKWSETTKVIYLK